MRLPIASILYEKLCSKINIANAIIELKSNYSDLSEFTLYGMYIKDELGRNCYIEAYLCGIIKENDDKVLIFLNLSTLYVDLFIFIDYKKFEELINSKELTKKIFKLNTLLSKDKVEEKVCNLLDSYDDELLNDINKSIADKKYRKLF